MILLLVLLFPFAISLVAFLAGGKKITGKELALQLAVVAVPLIVTYAIMVSGRTSDTEIWNGKIAEKHFEDVSCCHSYSCNCHDVCSGSGSNRSCSEHCDTCYEHSHDIKWEASSTTGREVYSNTCNRPGTDMPARWGRIFIGEPTAEEHSYTNYIKGNPSSILNREAVSPKLLAEVPEYPQVYDLYRALRVLDLGVRGVDVQGLNHEMEYINSQLGPKHQVNVILMVTAESDPTFAEAVRQKWIGGKKNDVIVIVGAPAFPEIAWVDTVSWTQSEAMKINIRDNILAMHTFDGHKVLGIMAFEIDQGFKRRHMKDFKYLTSGIEPSQNQMIALFIVAGILAIGMSIFCYRVDVFGEERSARIPGVYRRF